ncbi:hypothetical protein [Marinitenerispora sediminis]|uniref:Uncharacterized protein n=1 Tax=Marinitenerispora sediminis TaxID=1931232 RepID=A0A368T342_9ACTN|nr:hypothetical protein [Marinitenerispora sediminis]RCV55977.1 hypothetical protein DEF24_17265 [Marinitenerispora sediminis]RCV56266.1 hypothetical protein DEF28_03885 [Marinitenerispora sediminis]RCV61199.1 hypothetical protein DEF23_02805 [Marinitenerispora sediminis]
MAWLRRYGRPRDVESRLHLPSGERALARGTTPEGELVATTRALHLPDGRAVPWQDVDQIRWTGAGFTFVEEGAGEHTYTVTEPGRLAETVYERVTASILFTQHVPLTGDADDPRGARLVARRPPDGEDVLWRVYYDEGVDPTDPAVRERAARALTEVRDQMGL